MNLQDVTERNCWRQGMPSWVKSTLEAQSKRRARTDISHAVQKERETFGDQINFCISYLLSYGCAKAGPSHSGWGGCRSWLLGLLGHSVLTKRGEHRERSCALWGLEHSMSTEKWGTSKGNCSHQLGLQVQIVPNRFLSPSYTRL